MPTAATAVAAATSPKLLPPAERGAVGLGRVDARAGDDRAVPAGVEERADQRLHHRARTDHGRVHHAHRRRAGASSLSSRTSAKPRIITEADAPCTTISATSRG